MVLVGCLGPPYLSLRWLEPRLPGVGGGGGEASLVSASNVNGCRLGGFDSMFYLATIALCGFRGRVLLDFLGPSSLDSGWRTV